MIDFRFPTKIFFGSGVLSQLGDIVQKDFCAKRPFLVTDRGIIKSGIRDKVLSTLKCKGVQVFDEIEPNPKDTTVDKAGILVREIKPDLIIGLGGGSPLDAAKAVALLATNKGKIEDYEGREKYKVPPLPVLAVPTTCGTASEVTWVSVITNITRRFKMSIKGPHMFPSVALVDPDLLISLPPHLIASTGMDAITHAVEAYTVKSANIITDIFARKSIELIFSSIKRAFVDIKCDKEARERIMLGSTLAGAAFGNSDVASVHCLAESVGGLFDLPHGVLNSIFLPFVMEFNLPSALEKYGEIAHLLGIEEKNQSLSPRKLVEKIKDLSSYLEIPTFKSLCIKEEQFIEIAQKAFQNNSNPSNPRDAKVDDYLEILKSASEQ